MAEKFEMDLGSIMNQLGDGAFGEEAAKEAAEASFKEEIRLAAEFLSIPKPLIQEDKVPEKSNTRYVTDDINHYYNTMSPDDEKRLKWAKVKRYAASNEIIDCRVLSCAPYMGKAVFITTMIEGFPTIIPASEFFLPGTFDSSYENASDEEKVIRQRQMGQRMLGSLIKVVITTAQFSYDEASSTRSYYIAASRVSACNMLKHIFFFNKNKRTRIPQIKEGDTVEARIISYGSRQVRVEANGTEMTVSFGAMSSRKLLTADNVSRIFPRDKPIHMRVIELEKNPETEEVHMELSHRVIEEEIYPSSITEDKIGRSYLGVITNISANGEYYTAFIEAEGARCVIPARKNYAIGCGKNSKVAVLIRGITEDGKAFTGECKNC